MKYPLIEKFMPELKVTQLVGFGSAEDIISASDLEEILAKGQILHGCKRNKQAKDNWAWDNNYTDDTTTHTCLAIGIKPIESQEPVKIEEIVKALVNALTENKDGKIESVNKELISRIKRNGIVK